MKPLIFSIIFFISSVCFAQESGSQEASKTCDGTCLSTTDKKIIVEALKELKNIKESKAEIEIADPVIIIRDWDNRVYVNGGSKKPMKLKLKLGSTIERDMEATLPVQVYYREKPPDPMFRLRIRAQAGLLVPELVKSVSGKVKDFLDAGIGMDFLHFGVVNIAISPGIRSTSIGPGIDVTKNFGFSVGCAFVYSSFSPSVSVLSYFSFN